MRGIESSLRAVENLPYASSMMGDISIVHPYPAVVPDVQPYADTTPEPFPPAADSAGNSWRNTNDLINSAIQPGKGGVSPVGRAFQKHAGNPNRAGSFVGEVSGNAAQNTQNGAKYLNNILNNPNSTYIIRNTKAFGDVLDVRLPDGTGARWSADGKIFIGFLEKYTN